MAEWTLCLLCHHYVYLYIKGCINRDFGLIIWNRFGVALLLYCSMATIPNNDLSATSEGTFFFLIKSDKTLLEIRQKSELDFVSVKYLKKKMDSWAQNITRFIALNAIGKFWKYDRINEHFVDHNSRIRVNDLILFYLKNLFDR